MNIKQNLYNQCLEFIDNRLKTVQKTMQEIQESLLSETKSSAGDKHETGRAMLQLEREKAGNQLAEINKIKENFSKIDIEKFSNIIGLGTVVYTSQANYFIAISAGELKVNKDTFYAISPNTPIGQLLIGKNINDIVVFREQKFKVINID
ncbi:3-oxoacyl-ACP synthase [Flavivirga aquatica]|uniref:3-oxoacyl-ACP synthase n=1 Tax=Flavivirga aquatica TaxID=1849968 RepID=A0A1E5TE83_9FLAO|nr:3-oxoacyl-ACP synthase [Flavivirga aquatica]OEK09668.1 3-oxoacyl-ACP synthase [Flavivirga aquatica]